MSALLPPPPPPNAAWSYYLDFDGTLVELAATPGAVVVPSTLLDKLTALHDAVGGAAALITGRAMADIDRLTTPLRLPVAGQHGLERRRPDRTIVRGQAPKAALDRVRDQFHGFAAGDDRLLVEDKGMSVALHFRLAPDREAAAQALARALETELDGALQLLLGKALAEFRPPHTNKGDAIAAFQGEPPFIGRRPLFIGDDVTDEDGFRWVNQVGGISVRVGGGTTEARYALAGVPAVRAWLAQDLAPSRD